MRRLARIAFLLFFSALAACGPEVGAGGAIQVQLEWSAPSPGGARGVLSGVVDQVRLQARRSGQAQVEVSCAYEDYGCALLDVPAGGGLEVRAEGLAGGQVAFAGSTQGVEVRDGETAQVSVTMRPAYDQDVYAPAAVDDLTGAWLAATSRLELGWTSTGDDGRLGRASLYDFRWSSMPIDEANFDAAIAVDASAPREAGTVEVLQLVGSLPSGPVYVRLRVLDGETPPNASGLSNEVMVEVP